MKVELQINNSALPEARFVTWSPSPCRIRMTDPVGVTPPAVNVQITGVSVPGGGEVGLRSGTAGPFANGITVAVPTNGSSVPFFVAGTFGRPSVGNRDVT